MDVELQEKMDEIMEIMHQISWWMMELEKKEIEGIKITRDQVMNNKAINRLFGRGVIQYRELQGLIEKKIAELRENYIQNNAIKTDDVIGKQIMEELQNYLDKSYIQLRYIPYRMGDKNKVFPSIYEDTPYYGIIETEHTLQSINLDEVGFRIESNRTPNRYTFTDKSQILNYMGKSRFLENYVFDEIDAYVQDCVDNKANLYKEAYDFQIEKLMEQKYTQYYSYFNHKYNGFLQEYDIGKFGKVKQSIDDGMEDSILNMTEFEKEENIKRAENNLKKAFKEYMRSFIQLRDVNKNLKLLKEEKKKMQSEDEIEK